MRFETQHDPTDQTEGGLAARCRAIANSRRFQSFILGVIVLNGVLVGLETSPEIMKTAGEALAWINRAVLAIFLFEIVVRILAHGRRPLDFFRDGWNLFDFAIVATSLIPEAGSFATVARMARLLRVARLVSAFPELRLIIGTMLRSIPSMGHVVLLISLLVYIYGVFGYYLFHEGDPKHWGSLGAAALTLFQIITLEGWVEIQEASLKAHPWAWIFYASFIVVAVFVVINLFIAIVINNLETTKAEHLRAQDARNPQHEMLDRIEKLKAQLDEFERMLRQPAK